jgi:K+-transporting ATPase KdpF subunit
MAVREGLRTALSREGALMDYVISLVVAIAVGVYLFYALLRPERF